MALYRADSDADDEYERSLIASPRLPEDSETSPTDSEPLSTEHTPTTYGNGGDERPSPRTVITEWSAEECADFAASLGLGQYSPAFLDNVIVGEALVALKHDELKEMGISSVGHRLTILKSVYDTKIRQGVPVDPDHYIPLSAEQDRAMETATQDDIARIIQSIRLRDERMKAAEAELRKLADDYRRLREELLPVFKMAKDKSQPLPWQPNLSYSGTTLITDQYGHMTEGATSPPIGSHPEKSGNSLTRTFSKKLFAGGSNSKNNSPTYATQPAPEPRTFSEASTLDPSAAAIAASSHLTASMTGGQPSPKGNIPSPTSPAGFYSQQTLGSRSYSRDNSSTSAPSRSGYDHTEDSTASSQIPQSRSGVDRTTNISSRPDTSSNSRNQAESTAPSVEIFKSFRVSMDDPCYKVLPAALKKYNINEDWRLYALYIVYGDQERCLGLDEKPLILFKQLDKEGRKPMFMLRKQAQIADGAASFYSSSASAGIGLIPDSGGGGPRTQTGQTGTISLPGGVL